MKKTQIERDLCSWIRGINIVKMSILPKAIYRVNAIPIQISMAFFTEMEKNPISYMEPQKTLNSQRILRKKNKARGITVPDFKLYYTAIVIKILVVVHISY